MRAAIRIEHSAKYAGVVGRHRPETQSAPSGVDSYYGRYTPSALSALFRYVNLTLLAWVRRKFKRYKGHKVRAAGLVEKLARTRPDVFVHWRLGMTGAFA